MRKIILILLILPFIGSCEKNENELFPVIDSYPMIIGAEWTYDMHIIHQNFNGLHRATDTSFYTLRVWIEGDTIVNDSIHLIEFKSQLNGHNEKTFYKFLDREGLKYYNFLNSGKINPYSPVKLLSNITYGNPDSDGVETTGNIKKPGGVKFSEVIPALDIKLPLEESSRWIYILPSGSSGLQINKKVTGFETIFATGRDFNCYRVTWDFLNDPAFTGVSVTDWISEKGLVKRMTVIDGIVTVSGSGESMEDQKIFEVMTLRDFKL